MEGYSVLKPLAPCWTNRELCSCKSMKAVYIGKPTSTYEILHGMHANWQVTHGTECQNIIDPSRRVFTFTDFVAINYMTFVFTEDTVVSLYYIFRHCAIVSCYINYTSSLSLHFIE